jgi:hypothetical protein
MDVPGNSAVESHAKQNLTHVSAISVTGTLALFADSGRRRTGFRGEAEQGSGLIPNTIPG